MSSQAGSIPNLQSVMAPPTSLLSTAVTHPDIEELEKKYAHDVYSTMGGGSWAGGLHAHGDLRYCQKCSLYKPPRAHHCGICKRCILRMDHHCVWIWMNNYVGHANYKVLLVLVVYAVIACLYSLILLLGSLTVNNQKDVQNSESPYRTVYYYEVGFMWNEEKGGDVYSHPYDLGVYV